MVHAQRRIGRAPLPRRPRSAGRLRKWLGGSYFPLCLRRPFLHPVRRLRPLPAPVRTAAQLYWHGSGTPRFIGLSNYTFLLTDGLFWQSLANSAILWLLIVPVQTIFAVLAAVALSGRPCVSAGSFARRS
jgi:ABC-type glycerol-3-phosphate transport system permease component